MYPRIETQRLEHGTGRRTMVQRAPFAIAQAMRGVREIIERTQPAVRQMDVRGEVVALTPGFGGAFDIVEN